MNRYLLLCLPALVVLSSCAVDKIVIAPKKTLAVVAPVAKDQHPQVRFDVANQEVLDAYRDLLKIIPPGQGSGLELRRLADLELESSARKRLSNDPEIVAQGDQESFNAILHYNLYLKHYPNLPGNDQVLYQLARAYALDSNPYGAAPVMDRLVREYPQSEFIAEIQFRRGEHLFLEKDYRAAAEAYADVVNNQSRSLYAEKARYKLGWSQLKLGHYEQSLESFVQLLDQLYRRRQILQFDLSESMNELDRELAEDILRATGICFSYLQANDPISHFFADQQKKGYEPLLYSRLGDAYLAKQRITDAAQTYIALGQRFPLSPHAADLHDQALEVLEKAGFADELLIRKRQFIERFNASSEFWQRLDDQERIALQPILTRHMYDIATHYHALARMSGKPQAYRDAATYYQGLLSDFPQDPKAHHINFLLAESLNDGEQLEQAITEYNRSAYEYSHHNNSAEAAYAALLVWRKLRQTKNNEGVLAIDKAIIRNSIRFYDNFSSDERAPLVLLKATEMLYDAQQFESATTQASKIADDEKATPRNRYHAYIMLAHSLFKLERYDEAEEAYLLALEGASESDPARLATLRDNLALSIFRQGEAARAAAQHDIAAAHFLRVGEKVPDWKDRAAAEYDAATEYIQLSDWAGAITVLEALRKNFPEQRKWRRGIAEKLALAFAEMGRQADAGREMLNLAEHLEGEQRAEVLEAAAELFEKGGRMAQTIDIYRAYIATYPSRFSQVIEYSQRSASYFEARGELDEQRKWLRKVIDVDARAGDQRNDRSRYLAAMASLELARPGFDAYQRAELSVPLKKSLKRKKQLMERSLRAYSDAARYQVSQVTSEATFRIGEIYRDFAQALLQSERPHELNEEELEEYNYLLEEQAYPFEEKAIGIHEKNIQRISGSGAWDSSIRGSLRALGDLLPYRYAKTEILERFSDVQP